MRTSALLVAALVSPAIWITPCNSQGYQVQPMLATLEPSGSKARLTMLIKNTGAVPITLEMIPFRATVDEAGTPTRLDEQKDLLVYPIQTAIPPGKEQTVQVRYVGDPSFAQARMYGVRVLQLPVDFKTGAVGAGSASTDIKVSFNFLSHIIVSPSAAKAVLSVEDVGRDAQGDLLVRIVNSGDGIAVLNTAHLHLVDASGKHVAVASDQMSIGGFSAFMPKQTRRVSVASKALVELSGPIKSTIEIR